MTIHVGFYIPSGANSYQSLPCIFAGILGRISLLFTNFWGDLFRSEFGRYKLPRCWISGFISGCTPVPRHSVYGIWLLFIAIVRIIYIIPYIERLGLQNITTGIILGWLVSHLQLKEMPHSCWTFRTLSIALKENCRDFVCSPNHGPQTPPEKAFKRGFKKHLLRRNLWEILEGFF